MIKINLLPVKRKKPKPVPVFLVVAVLFLLVASIGSYYVNFFYYAERLKELEEKKAANVNKLRELDDKLKEVADFEARNKTFTERKNIIEQLTMNQSLPVRIMDEMSKSLTDGVWLQSMNIDGQRITISGIGFSNSDIVTFVKSLQGSESFVDVMLLGTTMGSMENTEVYMFNIVLQVKA